MLRLKKDLECLNDKGGRFKKEALKGFFFYLKLEL